MSILKAPAFIICVILFLLHQFMQKILGVPIAVLDPYLDSFLAMPILLTLLVVERRLLFRRGPAYCLSIGSIVAATIFVALVAELVFPVLSERFTADWWDVLAYALGGMLFYYAINCYGMKKEQNQQQRGW